MEKVLAMHFMVVIIILTEKIYNYTNKFSIFLYRFENLSCKHDLDGPNQIYGMKNFAGDKN